MKFLTFLKEKFEAWRQKKLAAIRSDIASREEMIRQCDAECELDISLNEMCQRSTAIQINAEEIDILRDCERFYESIAFA